MQAHQDAAFPSCAFRLPPHALPGRPGPVAAAASTLTQALMGDTNRGILGVELATRLDAAWPSQAAVKAVIDDPLREWRAIPCAARELRALEDALDASGTPTARTAAIRRLRAEALAGTRFGRCPLAAAIDRLDALVRTAALAAAGREMPGFWEEEYDATADACAKAAVAAVSETDHGRLTHGQAEKTTHLAVEEFKG